jgi:dihydrofolate reductase
MPELIADLFISVDGCAKGSRSPAYFGFGGPDLDRWIGDQMERPQRHLMGRKTYEALAALPEPVDDEGSLSLAATPTTVFSRTLRAVSWPQATISDDLTGTVGRLKTGTPACAPSAACRWSASCSERDSSTASGCSSFR